MRIYGVDVTSAPRRRKPIVGAACELEGEALRVVRFERIERPEGLAALLGRPGPWVAGFDTPLGQPAALVEALGWPADWAGYVALVGGMPLAELAAAIAGFRAGQPPGLKHRYRAVDRPARSCSPMMLAGVPVAKMFWRVAPLLLAAGVSVPPGRPSEDTRVALEVYPRLAADKWVGRASYKSDERRRQSAAHAEARRAILDGARGLRPALDGRDAAAWYGCAAVLGEAEEAACLADASGDTLDALLAAMQAAWAARAPGYGIPPGHEREGWISDPALASL